MRKAFIYRRGGLGDTLFIFPVFEILKTEGYHITTAGNRDYLSLALKIGWIDRIVSAYPDEDFDLKIIIGINGTVHPFPEDREWIVDYYIKRLCLENRDYSSCLPFKAEDIEDSDLFRERVIIHPSSGSIKKNLPPGLFLRLKENFVDPLFVAGEADHWLSGFVRPYYFDHDIIKTASLLKRARLFIGADSGLAHLSAYLGIPTIIIYGPTDPVVWRPVGDNVLQIRPSDCKPCFPHVCKEKHCFNAEEIIVEEIMASAYPR
ncbi:MAG: glycosyltransferase family 9 protein [Thermodesulfovibrionales bacterium]